MRSGERIRGALFGGLVGDALGVPVEFTSRKKRAADPVTNMRSGGTWGQPAGTWSDDSSMALASMASLCEHGWDPAAMMAAFVRWAFASEWTPHGEVFDIGNTTRDALAAANVGTDWQHCARTDRRSNGNGSLMRIMPVSLWTASSASDERIAIAMDASRLTHGHIRACLCCAWHAELVYAICAGAEFNEAISRAAEVILPHVPEDEFEELEPLFTGAVCQWDAEKIAGSGYVVDCLAASLWCLARHDDYVSATLAAVNLGDDTDTTGCVTGGLAGLLYGKSAIPREWINSLARCSDVAAMVADYTEAVEARWIS